MNETQDNRPMFHLLDSEQAEINALNSRISRAADQAAREVDIETIRMYTQRGLKLPPRLAKISSAMSGLEFQSYVPLPEPLKEKLIKSTAKRSVLALRKADSGRRYIPTYAVRYEQDLAVRGV